MRFQESKMWEMDQIFGLGFFVTCCKVGLDSRLEEFVQSSDWIEFVGGEGTVFEEAIGWFKSRDRWRKSSFSSSEMSENESCSASPSLDSLPEIKEKVN